MYQGGEELGDVNELLKTEPSGFGAGWETAQLSYGGNLEEETYQKIVKTFPDYTENTKDYDAWITSNEWTMGNTNIVRYEKAIDNDEFRLDAGDNIILGANGVQGMQILFDMDAMRGALLARKHGYTRDTFNAQYSELAKGKATEISKQREGTSTLGYVGGVIAGHMMQPESLQEIATSPAKIMGSTILKGMGKAFVAEGAVGLVGEVAREQRIREHMEKADLDYTLWDSVQQILLGAGLGGTFRAIGSGVIDAKTAREIGKRVTDPTDKTIVGRFFQREEYKLTQDTNKHLSLVAKAREDMDNGRAVDIADATDIDINTKTNPDIEEISLRDELVKRDIGNGYEVEVKKFEEEFAQADEIKPKEITDEIDIYDGMATKEQGDELIREMGELDPEIKAEMEAIEVELKQPIKEPTVKEVSPQVTATTGNIVKRAQALQGNKYVWGGTDLKKGADCSGFVQSIHKEQGINLPRTAWGQAKGSQGKNIAFNDMQIGDTIYFKPSQTGKKYAPVTHTGIITGTKNGKFIMTHAKGKKYGTVTEELSPGYIDRFYSAKRFTEDGVQGERVPTKEASTIKEPKEKVIIDEEITPEMEQTILKQEELDTIEFNKLQEEAPRIEEIEVPEVKEVEAPTFEKVKKTEAKKEPKPKPTKERKKKTTISELAKINKAPPETVGALYGFEQDEEGYWTYNVAKGALGAAGVHIAGKAFTSKKMKEFVIKHMKEYI